MSQTSSPSKTRTARRRSRRAARMAAALALAVWLSGSPSHVSAQLSGNRRGGGVGLLPSPGAPNTPPNFAAEIAPPIWATADHPLFRSSYMGEEDRVVANSSYGPVTSRDLYLWLILRDGTPPNVLEAYQKARTAKQRDDLAKLLRQEIEEFVFTNYAIPEIMGNAPCEPVAGWREQLRLLPAYQLVYILRLIKPSVCIQEADRVKYLKENIAQFALPERWRVRYIRLQSTFNEPIQEQDRVEARMVDLRQQIAQGDLTFAEAARRFSQAPSAARGGELPPIRKGELFFFFDEAVSNLEPGEVSQPFRGPDGSYYIVQLLENLPAQEPTLSDPTVAFKVDDGLRRKVLRAEYEYANRRLYERSPYMILTSDWDNRSDEDLVAGVGRFGLSKCQVRDIFPFIEGENLQRRDDIFGKYLTPILERAAMAQEVSAGGLENDPILQRARWMVANLVRRDALAESCEAGLELNDEIVRSFWRRNPDLFTPMELKRIFRISLVSTSVAPSPEALVSELARILTVTASGEKPTALPPAFVTSPGSVIDEVLSAGGAGALSLFGPQENIDTTGSEPLDLQPLDLDLSPLDTTGPLTLPESQIESTPELLEAIETTGSASLAPSLSNPRSGDRSSGEETTAAKAASRLLPQVTTTASDGASTSTTVDLSRKRGGAAPQAVSGGMPPAAAVAPGTTAAAVPGSPVAPSSPAAVAADTSVKAPVNIGDIPPDEAVPNPCCPPDTGIPPFPGHTLGDFVPAMPPAVPWPSAIPFNPDLRFPKMSAREVTELFSSYVSPDFGLRVEDLGFIYVQDRLDLPKPLATLTPGTFSYPAPVGPAAAAYYVANSKRPPKPSFEEIKSRVYFTYRQLRVNDCLEKTKKQALKNAKIQFQF